MTAPTFYIETSVWGNLAHGQPADRKTLAHQLLRRLDGQRGSCAISRVILDEVALAPPADATAIREQIETVRPIVLQVTPEATQLARSYIEAGVLPKRRDVDALHIALATCSSIDYVVSWNHRHMTSAAKRRAYEIVNREMGYEKTPHICNPVEACQILRGRKRQP